MNPRTAPHPSATTVQYGLRAAAVAALLLLQGCLATAPQVGGGTAATGGAAGGATAENQNKALEKCDESLGTLAMEEDTNAPWYAQLRGYQLGSTTPVLRLMIQQSNCFVIVERGGGLNDMMRERQLMRGEEGRAGSNMGGGQMVAADYLMRPSIQFSGKTGGGGGGLAGFLPGALGTVAAVAGSVGVNEANTTLLLIDIRSGVQISAAEGTSKNYDFGLFGAAFTGGLAGSGGGYSKTPQGRVITSAFADSFNQMVKALRNYKAQTVKGGLGTGGRLGVSGGQTPASQQVQQAPAPAATPAASTRSTTQPKPKAPKKPAAKDPNAQGK
ncbi:CsgG/HfaB family protein [Pseudorhodoferax sp.]|uniref:CsgG/HfaB family protein n=1 Tax=Pseudorhodoferax sp. TaxID=1993553 RepID=UPI001B6F8D29|nr:CsgG/HfaB family protein [Pseudorhodoferax sp.]MBP8145569.1 peptidoglycan-binding protein [Inhella sp.]